MKSTDTLLVICTSFLILCTSCSFIEDIIDDQIKPEPPIVVEPTPEPSPIPVPSPEPQPEPPVSDLFIPDNCSNPPKHITPNDGFKCMASTTRGGSVVCLLPYQFTWKPWIDWTDHHGVTMKCNANDEHFDKVILKTNNQKIELNWDKCQNWVGTSEGKIGRQHFRHPSIKWDDIKNKVKKIKMVKNNRKTCLKF